MGINTKMQIYLKQIFTLEIETAWIWITFFFPKKRKKKKKWQITVVKKNTHTIECQLLRFSNDIVDEFCEIYFFFS